MSHLELGKRLADLCRQGLFDDALSELYASDAISIALPHVSPREVQGLEVIREKGRRLRESLEAPMTVVYVSEPLVCGNVIAIGMIMEFSVKERGPMRVEEVCVYGARDGKIVSEQFFV